MPTEIDRTEVQRLVAAGAQLVDVMPAEEYSALHLPSARNLPLKQLNAKTTAQLRKDQPVIVYCADYQ